MVLKRCAQVFRFYLLDAEHIAVKVLNALVSDFHERESCNMYFVVLTTQSTMIISLSRESIRTFVTSLE